MRVKRTWPAIISVIAGSGMFTPAAATDKFWIAHEAQLIIIGRFHEQWVYPWVDGWHVAGTLDVEEILFGAPVPKSVNYRLVCRLAACRTWPPPRITALFGDHGIWFLRSIKDNTWRPPGEEQGIDPGYRGLDQRATFEDYIRIRKRER